MINKITLFVLILSFAGFFGVSQKSYAQDFFGQVGYPDGQNGQSIAVDQNNNVYVGVWGKGILKSTNQGNSFTTANTGLTNFLIKDIFVASSGKIYVTTFGGGVFVSVNGGSSWTAINNGLPTLLTTTINIYPTGLLILGTYGYGIFVSSDGGLNWVQSNLGLPYRAVTAIEISRNGYVLVGTYGGGIYQSRDTAKTWRRGSSGLGNNLFIQRFAKDLVGDVFVATNGGGIYSSPNDGLSWSRYDTTAINDLNITCMVIAESNEPIIGTRNGGIQYWDADLYRTWRTPFQPLIGVTAVAKSSNNRLYAVGADPYLYVSTNYGRNWVQIGQIKDDAAIKSFPLANGEILALFHNYTLMYSSDYGNHWVNTNLTNASANNIVKTNSGKFILGTNKGLYTSTDGISWTLSPRFQDTVIDAMAYKDGFLVVAVNDIPTGNPPPLPTPTIHTSIDDGNTFTKKTYPTNGPVASKIRISLNGTIYARMQDMIYKSTDNSNTWSTITLSGFSGVRVNDIDVDAINANFFYVATTKGLLKSQDAGNSWLYSNLSYLDQDTLNCTGVTVTDNGTIYVVASFTRDIIPAYGVWYSNDTGYNWDSLNTSVTSAPYMSIAGDNESNLFLSSIALFRSFNPDNMPVPAIESPKNNTKGLDLSINFVWHPAQKADMYEMQVADDVDFTDVIEYVIQTDTTYTLESPLTYNKTYYWRVRSKTDGSYSNWSDVATFSTLLNAPTLIDPPNSSTGVSLNPTFTWQSVPNALYYQIEVAKDTKFTSLVFSADSLQDTTIISQTLISDATFYWRVKAKNDNSISPWSDVWSFQTTFGAPSLISPKKDSINVAINPVLTWGKVVNATYYNVMLSNDNTFKDVQPIKVDNVANYQASSLDYDTQYYWKVSTGSNQGESDYSVVWNFTTLIAPTVLTSPVDSAKNVPVTTSLNWKQINNYTSYEVIISNMQDFSTFVLDTIISGTQISNLNLSGYKLYYWKVRVNQVPKLGYWSDTWLFTTYLNKTGLRYPTNHQVNLPSTISFLWFPTDGADYYFLQIARDSTFNDLIFSKDSIQSTTFEVSDLSFSTKYYWRVRSSNKDGFSDWSDVWDFETNSVVPTLLRPANNSVNLSIPVIFEWKKIPGALTYFMQVSNDETFTNLIYSKDGITTTLDTLDNTILLPLTTYYWRVKAEFEVAVTDWSTIWVFSVGTDYVPYSKDISILNAFPNPTSDNLKVQFNPKQSGFANIMLVDINGKEVKQIFNGYVFNILNEFTLNTTYLPVGSYFIIVQMGDVKYINKVQVNK
jgi:photosystem II stability/assembly factor-like uncharacterized protein